MNFIYEQKTGRLVLAGDPQGPGLHTATLVGVGYSGAPEAKNDPSKQSIKSVGPIPCGWYTISEPEIETYEGKAPPVFHLIPDAANEMFGRAGFLIHGDSVSHPGTASEGCIIMAHDIRLKIAASGVRRLQVVSAQ